MSEYSAFMRWQVGCRDHGVYGATSGDTLHHGFQYYDQTYPCPNGLPIDMREPREFPLWVAKVARAKAFLEECRREDRLTEIRKLELFGSDDVSDLIALAKGEKTVEQCNFENGRGDSV